MPVVTANVVVTLPQWSENRIPSLVESLTKAAKQYWVDVSYQPLSTASLVDDAKCRAILRELNDFDEPKDDRKLFLVCPSLQAPESIELFESLQLALKLRTERLTFVAMDNDTALTLTEVIRFSDINPRLRVDDIFVPKDTGRGASETLEWLKGRIQAKDLILVVERVDEQNALSKALVSERIRVFRMPTYKMSRQKMSPFPDNDLPTYLLVSDATAIAVAKQGFNTFGVNQEQVTFVGSRPALEAFAKKECPDVRWLGIPEMSTDAIMNAVSQDG